MRPFSYHVHTEFCDGKSSAEEMVLSAIAAGFDSLGFSSHGHLADAAGTDKDFLARAEGNILYTDREKTKIRLYGFAPKGTELYGMRKESIEPYRAEVLRLAEMYKDKINIFLGIEQDSFARPEHIPNGARYVIGSVHYVEKDGAYISVDYSADILSKGVRDLFDGDYLAYAEAYYNEVAKIYDKTHCDIIGHIDLLTKFNEHSPLIDETHPRYRNAAISAAESLARRGLIFEINTGAISRGLRTTPYPTEEILRVIRESGGKVTYSSDCHMADTIACGFEDAVALAKRCGFKSFMKLSENGFYEEEF
jgi:histidinol-phosphatase (PHP family)